VHAKVRDWADVDYYAMLGIPADAPAEEITRTFRARVKHAHPDVAADAAAVDEFRELTEAYSVLSEPALRREYDRVRASVVPPVGAGRGLAAGYGRDAAGAAPIGPHAPRVHKPLRWTPRLARAAFVGGIVFTVLGVVAAAVTFAVYRNDATRRADYVPVRASRIGDGNIRFTARDGATVVTAEPRQYGEGTKGGPTVAVRYDPDAPERVIVDANTTGRDITLAIVALKFLVGGAVMIVVGRRARTALAHAPPGGAA